MDGSVVVAAEQQRVGDIGGAAVEPGHQVVGVGVGRRPVTAWESAAAVTGGEQPSLLRGEQPPGAAQVDHDAVLIEEQRGQLRVAGDPGDPEGVQERRTAGGFGGAAPVARSLDLHRRP